MVVQHNISAMTANRYYGVNNKGLASSLEKLASGYAINKAGDNAAGLAVSEKMRAQIGGLTQASKNAEDGISMVQTFEGALQETDSILQRMRTLAVQSANGSYQDDVDRDAIQLEFDQLNDELNQIADTDYNGTVVLNGGQMADGLKAVDNKFDYANKKDQIKAVANEKINAEIETARANATKAAKAFNTAKFDLTESGAAREFNDVDTKLYDKTVADNLWKDLGLTTNSSVDCKKYGTEINVTFEATKAANGTITWTAVSGTRSGGTDGTVDLTNTANGQLSKFTATTVVDGGTATDKATGLGGVYIASTTNTAASADVATMGNVVVDLTKVKTGDTITMTYRNADPTKYAPTDIGFNDGTYSHESTGVSPVSPFTVKLGDGTNLIPDKDMTADIKAVYDALEDAEITVNYDGTTYNTTSKSGGAVVTLQGSEDEEAVEINREDTAFHKITLNGQDMYTKVKSAGLASANDTVEIYASNSSAATNKALMTITLPTAAIATTGTDPETAGTIATTKGKISFDAVGFDDGSSAVSMYVGDDKKLSTSNDLYKAMTDAQKTYDDAVAKKARMQDDANWEETKAYAATTAGGRDAVSISDKYDQSAAKLTYADSMSLQVGARTKDLVNFTFAYNTDDLGGLEKNLNCSAREGGLETEKLDLTTQQGANDAIDKIDKALNKVNMVRATFGAIQNRLEHKINNIDTNTENMTAAESRIRDTQMDKEMMKFTSSQILSQASQSMLAQANQLPQGVLQLLG